MAAAVTVPQHQVIAGALTASFDKWATNHDRYRSMYKKMPREVLQIIACGLAEVEALTPMSWDTWWLREHNRFRKDGVRQEDKRYITQLVHSFLGDFARGKVSTGDKRTSKKPRRQASSK